jgi:hypothetical protein
MQLIQQFRAHVLQPFCRIRKGLLKTIAPDIDVPDDLPLIGFIRTLRLGIDGHHHIDVGDRVRPTLSDGIPEKKEDIIVLPSLVPVTRTILLPIAGKAAPAAAKERDKPYQADIPQEDERWIKLFMIKAQYKNNKLSAPRWFDQTNFHPFLVRRML